MAKRNRKSDNEETSYWLSYSDMMAALLLVFVLIISFTMLQAKAQYEEKEAELVEQQEIMELQQELLDEQQATMEVQQATMEAQQAQLDKIIGVRGDLIDALRDEFEDSSLRVSVDPATGAITFDSSVLFDSGKSSLKPAGKEFLEEFLPRYFSVLLNPEYKEYISEIIIEGHTDTDGDYFMNLELSQARALSVAKFCLNDNNGIVDVASLQELKAIMTANGRSFSDLIYNDDGTVNMAASRRVEFKFRLKDDEMIDEMINILN